jgi:DNA-binding NtrC family response regulator
LRERGEDVLLLTEHYVGVFAGKLRKREPIKGLAPEAEAAFRRYSWPGNVRELKNVIERATILEDGDTITLEHMPRDIATAAEAGAATSAKAVGGEALGPLFPFPPEGVSLEEVETYLVRQAVERSGGNQKRAGELLGISRDQLRYRLKKLEEAQGHTTGTGT